MKIEELLENFKDDIIVNVVDINDDTNCIENMFSSILKQTLLSTREITKWFFDGQLWITVNIKDEESIEDFQKRIDIVYKKAMPYQTEELRLLFDEIDAIDNSILSEMERLEKQETVKKYIALQSKHNYTALKLKSLCGYFPK